MDVPSVPLMPEVLLGPQPVHQPSLELASPGVQRYVWQSAFGAMLIEVRDGAAYVNGGRVTSINELRLGAGDNTAPREPVAAEDRTRPVRT